MRKFLMVLPLLAAFVFLGAGCRLFGSSSDYSRPLVSPAIPAQPAADESQIQEQPTGIQAEQTGVFRSQDGVTMVDVSHHEGVDPDSGRPVFYNPFYFDGTTTVFENQFSWRVKDDKGNLIAGGQAYANSPDMGLPGGFSIKGFYDQTPATTTGSLEVYDNSPKDGSEMILLKLPVLFGTGDVVSAKANNIIRDFVVYFSNTKKDPNMMDCSKVYPVHRQIVDDELDQVAEMNLHALLLGPTEAERKDGYLTQLPQGVHDPKVEFKDGKIWVTFDDTLEQGMGGSCRVGAVRAQIEETVKAAYPDFKPMVVISVNGRTEDLLQP